MDLTGNKRKGVKFHFWFGPNLGLDRFLVDPLTFRAFCIYCTKHQYLEKQQWKRTNGS